MIDANVRFFYTSIDANHPMLLQYWDSFYDKLGPEGRLAIDMARYFGRNRFVSRSGVWTTPWTLEIVPGFEMPKYDSNFKMKFDEVTDLRALDIKNLINQSGARVAVYYSGGIDSTVCLAALLKNLNKDELRQVDVCMSTDSIIENPYFFEKYILNKLNIIDSAKIRYSDIEELNGYAITSDQGDSIFGTELGTQMYYSYRQLANKVSANTRRKLENYHMNISDEKTHYSEYADMLILYFELEDKPNFGKLFYEKFLENIRTSHVPIHSLHDFFWWYIFNIKYMECALRSTIYYYGGVDRQRSINSTVINWFNHENYQKWSLVNNNNGQKIRGITAATYKWAAKEYIYAFDSNPWYFKYKLKLSSLKNIIQRNPFRPYQQHLFALDNKYNAHLYDDPGVRAFIEESLAQFK